jgi:hypothetical protein
MSYYPSSQIKPNQYTNGGEYILSTTKENYKGYYYELSNGRKYTGKNNTDKPNILIIERTPLNTTKTENDFNVSTGLEFPNLITTINYGDTSTYLKLPTNVITNDRSIPSYNLTIPTQQDYNLGVFSRYFCKKTNELKYIEIDKTIYSQLTSKSSEIAWDLYIPLTTLWYLKGEKEKVYSTNKNLIMLIEQNQKWHGFSQYFKEQFSKYYLES